MSTLSEASHGPASEAAATLAPSTRTSNRVSFPAAAGTRRTYLPSGPAATVASGGGAGSPRASRRAWSRGASQATAETVTPAAGRAPTRNRPRSSAAPAGLTMNATTEATMTKPVGTRTMSRPPPGPGLTPPSGVRGTARRGSMDLSHLLAAEWRPALGCTEPAAVAYAAASAATQAAGEVRHVRLVCDPRIYKNCYAVGIPNSGHRAGILWALAIGALLEDASRKLECFRGVGAPVLQGAADLIARGALTVEVERSKKELYVECTVERAGGVGRAVLEREHTRLIRLERDGTALPLDVVPGDDETAAARGWPASLSFAHAIDAARAAKPADRAALRRGVEYNLAI